MLQGFFYAKVKNPGAEAPGFLFVLLDFRWNLRLDCHADVPCAPDSGTQVTDSNTVTNAVNVLALAADRLGNEADAVYDVVVFDLGNGLAVLGLNGDGLVANVGDGALEVGGNLLVSEHITQEGSIGQADVLCRNEVCCILYDDGVLALENHLVCCFAGRLAAAEEDNLVADFLLVAENVGEGEALLEAGDSHLSGSCAGCNDDLVELTCDNAQVVDFGVEADLDALLLNFSLVPCNEFLVVFLEGHCRCGEEEAANAVSLFKYYRMVATLLQNQSCLYAADTSADDCNLLGLGGGNDLVAVVLHGGRSQCATAKVEGVFQTLDVCGALVLSKVEAAVVATDAGLDLVFLASLNLEDPLGVNKVLTCDCDCVQATCLDFFCSGLGEHTACTCNGLIGELLCPLDVLQVAVIRHVLRRMCPVPRVVSTVVAVEEVVTLLAKVLDSLLGFLVVTAPLFELFAGDCALPPALAVGLNGVTEGYGEVFASLLLDLLNDLNRETETVLERAAVLVVTLVPVLHGELVKQVTFVNSVDFYAVNACVTQHLCGLTKVVNHFLNFLNGKRTGGELFVPTVGGCGCGCTAVLYVNDGRCNLVQDGVLSEESHPGGDCHGAAEACCQLDEELCAGLMELFHVGLQFFEHLLVLVEPAAAHGITDTLHAGEDEAYAVLSSVEQEVCSLLIEMAGLKPAKQGGTTHRTLDYAVLDFAFTNLKGGKQRAILFVHWLLPFFYWFSIKRCHHREILCILSRLCNQFETSCNRSWHIIGVILTQ